MTPQLTQLWKSLRPSIVVLFVLFALNSSAQQTLIGITNHTWRYFAEVNDDPGASWSNPGFDDSSWPTGRGLFGADTVYLYPFNTSFLGPAQGGPLVAFFRTTFNRTGPISGQVLTMTNYFDDGVVVYLNGVEITRYNMPTGPADYRTFALGPLPEPVVRVHQITLDFLTNGNSNPLVSGQNVLAASVHNNTTNSSDTVFGLSVVADHVEPCLVNDLQLTNRTILEGRATTFVVSATCLPAPTVQWYRNVGQGEELIAGATSASYTLTNARVFDSGQYYAKLTNPAGTVSSRQATLIVFHDDVPPNLVSARLGATQWEIIATVDEALCVDSLACGSDALAPLNWEIVNADNPLEFLTVNSVAFNGLALVFTLEHDTPWKTDTRYTVRPAEIGGGQTGVGDLFGFLMSRGANATTPPAASAISVKISGSNLYTFDTAPSQFEFSTFTWVGQSSDASTLMSLEAAVQNLGAALINQRLPEAPGNPPATSITAIYASDTKNLITRPAGVLGNVIVAHLRNDSGSAQLGFTVTYTLTDRLFGSFEEVPGHLLYYSFSGASNTWSRIFGTFNDGTSGSKTGFVNLSGAPWPAGTIMYILIADDNAVGSEGAYEIDNFRVNLIPVDPCDSVIPTLARAAGPNNTTVVLTFSKRMAPSATNILSYSVSGATVTAASLNAAGMEVTLTTSPRAAGNAAVTITGLRDSGSCNFLITPNPTTFNLTTVQKIVDWNASWEYNTNNLDSEPTWKTTGGTGWWTGNGLFGTETSAAATNSFPTPIATAIPPPNTNNQFLTSYFRKSVNLPALSAGQSYAIGHYTDDGAIFYLDGSEIGRVNMQPGAVSYTNLSIASSLEGRMLAFPFTTTAGSHILAVEVHQSANTSSDTVFGAQVIIVPTSTPSLSIAQSGTNAVVIWNADSSWVLAGSTNVAGPYDPAAGNPFRGFSRPIATPTTQFYKLNYVPQP